MIKTYIEMLGQSENRVENNATFICTIPRARRAQTYL